MDRGAQHQYWRQHRATGQPIPKARKVRLPRRFFPFPPPRLRREPLTLALLGHHSLNQRASCAIPTRPLGQRASAPINSAIARTPDPSHHTRLSHQTIPSWPHHAATQSTRQPILAHLPIETKPDDNPIQSLIDKSPYSLFVATSSKEAQERLTSCMPKPPRRDKIQREDNLTL